MTTTPYDIIGKEALYDMIDYFYTLVEKDERLNHLFPGDFAETSRKQ
ncbi:TPA: globin, partial [Staphylococcus aureus]|nr:globin [Staphylococcus aureus]